ncbi:MAG: hypothetical protein B7Z37_06405 [Verrucomicrobia bacterium 12-59-8]|nr:MAG: hypothetical protein B7Z37_06405 [Verrucomicrobia bacterium 12-59-8]
MEYTKRIRHGDVGEHLVAFRIMRDFKWPCRLLGIDLGIDAETEILTEDGNTTGDTIRLQIKSVASVDGKSFSITTSEEHINYWQRHCTPVIFCGVCLATERVFWKQITALEDYSTEGVSKKVSFCCEHDLLDARTVVEWRKFASPDAAHELANLMAKYQSIIDDTEHSAFDGETCKKYSDLFAEGRGIRQKVESILAYMPWKITGVQLTKFKAMQRTLQIRDNDNEHHWSTVYYN